MRTLPEAVRSAEAEAFPSASTAASAEPLPPPDNRARRAWRRLRWPQVVYLSSRLLYLVVAAVDTRLHGWHLGWELSNWDGFWYLLLAATGYPAHVLHTQSTLGFFPLYPLGLWGLQHALALPRVLAGVTISLICGAVATMLIGRLCETWWDERTARRAVLLVCAFPGSIVFSMIYTEGLMLAAVAGCLLALSRRRWVTAGALGAVATATGPTAVAIIPACLVACGIELRRAARPGVRRPWRALWAPVLAPVGLLAFAGFLWAWTGTPFASFRAQRYAWHEKSTPMALVHTARRLLHQVERFHSLHHPGINLNYVAGLLGAVFLAAGLWLLWQRRREVGWAVLAWTAVVSLLIVTSANTPPNPRMLLVDFPVLVVFARRLRGRAFRVMLAVEVVLLVSMSLVTYVGTGLRP